MLLMLLLDTYMLSPACYHLTPAMPDN